MGPQLQAFIAIVECKTVHAAAHAIHMTQTAVTQRLRALEIRLGTTLFVRTRRGMQLTQEGEALLRYCHAVRDLEGEALAKIAGAGEAAMIQVTITGPSSIMRSRIIPHYLKVMQRFPNLLMQYDIDDTHQCLANLRNGQAQFAVVQQESVVPEMQSKLLAPERYVLVCCKAWQKRALKDIIREERIVDFNPSDQMTFNYLKQHKLLNLARHDRHFANRTDILAALLVAGRGYSLLTTEFVQPYVERDELIVLNNGKEYDNQLALAWYERPEPPKYFQALIAAVS